MSAFVAVICGLKSEAAAIRASLAAARIDPSKVRIAISGANAARAEDLTEGLIAAGARAVISAGLCGGLAPDMKSGDLVIGERVVSASGDVILADRALLAAAPKSAQQVAIFGSDDIIDSVEEKARLFGRFASQTVDMESHGAARAAARAGAPFIAVRAVADAATRALPKAALGAVTAAGGVNVVSVLIECVKAPQQFEEIAMLGRESGAATDTLRRDFGDVFRAFLVVLDL